jgi:hypothetical protein
METDMANAETAHHAGDPERRTNGGAERPVMAGVPVRPEDIEPTVGLHGVAKLFRVLSGLLLLLMALQVLSGLTGTVEISYGVLFAEAVRLIIFAGLLWGAGDLADLYVKSHHDTRATRILMARLTYRVSEGLTRLEAHAASNDAVHGTDDGHKL